MRCVFRLAAAALLVGTSAAGHAEEETGSSPDFSKLDDTAIGVLLDNSEAGWIQRPCAIGVPGFSELGNRHPEQASFQRGLLMSRSFCASQQGDPAKAIAEFDEFENRFGETEMDQYRIALAFDDGQPRDALDRMLKMASRSDGEAFSGMNIDYFYAIIRELRKRGMRAELESFAAQIYRQPVFADLSTGMQGSIAHMALRPAIASADKSQIRQVLRDIRNPSLYPDYLASREYEAAWPLIEQHVGKGLANVTRSYREWAMARLENDTFDRDRFSAAAHSLLYDGKFVEAVALVEQWRERPGAFDRIEEGDGWAVNIEAYALDGLGRFEEADALFDRLAALDAEENPWVVNFVINRSSRLVGHGHWEAGLEAAALARKVAENHGSLYAKMLVARDFTCAYANSDRAGEADSDIAFLVENQGEFPWITVQALQCLGRDEDAVALLVASLGDEVNRPGVLSDLQDEHFDLFYTPSILPKPFELVGSSPEVHAAFEKYARIIPIEFAPAASNRRQNALKRMR